jgi:branched-chain amino acid transport system ATP-binding protein
MTAPVPFPLPFPIVEPRKPRQHGAGGPFIIETKKLAKDFKGFRAVNGVDLKIARGTIHALIGPNGAGKTTCFNLITKFLKPSSGAIFFNGLDITDRNPAQVARMGMVRSFQISSTFPDLTVLQNVRLALQRPTGTSYRFWSLDSSLDYLDNSALRLLAQVGLVGFEHLKASELSYGRKRALEIATTLALDPEMLLLDEPTSGMGREDVQGLVDLIRRIAADRTVLMVEHNLSVVSDLSDTITVLARGEILAEGPYATISRDDRVAEAYMGTGRG